MNQAASTEWAETINPRKMGFSPKLTAIVGAIIGHDYGVVDGRGGKLSDLSITSDGYVLARSTASDGGGAFLGTADEMQANVFLWLAELTSQDRLKFNELYERNVQDWRGTVSH